MQTQCIVGDHLAVITALSGHETDVKQPAVDNVRNLPFAMLSALTLVPGFQFTACNIPSSNVGVRGVCVRNLQSCI